MKQCGKILNICLIILIFITTSGFKGCQNVDVFWHIIMSCVIGTGGYVGNGDSDPGYSIACGEAGTILTSDGRPPASWITRPSGTTQNLNQVKIYSVPDSNIAFAVGNSSTVIASHDKGHTWVNRSITEEQFNVNGLDFILYNNNPIVHVIVVGDSGTVFRSNNYGSNWVWYQYFPNTTRKLISVAAISNQFYVAVGDRGTVVRTTNAGESWTTLNLADTNRLNKIIKIRYDTHLIIGNNGKLFRSTNYGAIWQQVQSGTTKHLRDGVFKNENEGVVVGDDGTVRHTTNAGINWTPDPYFNGLTTRDIISVTGVDSVTANSITRNNAAAELSGSDSTFFTAVSSEPLIGIEPITNFIAEIFSLKQNYPNPFNPITNISITLSKTSYAKLIVYDIQGKAIETLVDKELKAGAYNIHWNASPHPSGVYFYKLITSDFTQTKKMVLVK